MFRIFAYLHRHPESGIFYFRLTVPPHLRHSIGKREIKKSLNTGLRADAILLAHQCYVEANKLFQRAEKRMSTPRKKTEAEEAADVLKELEIMGAATDGTLQKITLTIAGQKVVIEQETPAEEVESAAKLLNLAPAAPAIHAQPAAPPPKQDKSISLAKMAALYLEEQKLTGILREKTIEANESIFQLIIEVTRNPAAETVGYKTAVEFKNTLLRLPPNKTKGKYAGLSVSDILKMNPKETMSIASVNKYIHRASALFEWGKRHGHVTNNPFSGLALRTNKAAHKKRDRFTTEELQRLFDPAHLHRDARRSYMFWLPWLGLYTGARLEELCQLHLADIRQEGEVWVFDINEQDEKQLKTSSSARLVPIHQKLIEIGLLEHVAKLRKRGEKRLFPELKQSRDGYGQIPSKWFARYRATLGIKKPFHSFRHTAIDEMKQRGGEYKKIAAIAGHVDESMTFGTYGKPYGPEGLYPVICLLDFDLGT